MFSYHSFALKFFNISAITKGLRWRHHAPCIVNDGRLAFPFLFLSRNASVVVFAILKHRSFQSRFLSMVCPNDMELVNSWIIKKKPITAPYDYDSYLMFLLVRTWWLTTLRVPYFECHRVLDPVSTQPCEFWVSMSKELASTTPFQSAVLIYLSSDMTEVGLG